MIQGEREHKRLKDWYKGTNKHHHEEQIAAKQQRTSLLRKIKQDDPEAGKTCDQTKAEGPHTQRRRGRPRKATYFDSKDDINQDEPHKIPYDQHHYISNVQNDLTTLLPLVANNQDDPFLKVRSPMLIPLV